MQSNDLYITKHVEAIKQKALFLEKKGFFDEEISEFIIKYLRNDYCSIGIYYGRFSDNPDVSVRFEHNGLSKPENYGLGWFRNLKRLEAGEKDLFKRTIKSR